MKRAFASSDPFQRHCQSTSGTSGRSTQKQRSSVDGPNAQDQLVRFRGNAAVENYLQKTSAMFHDDVLKKVEEQWKALRSITDSLYGPTPLDPVQLGSNLRLLGDGLWQVMASAKIVHRRNMTQNKNVTAKLSQSLACSSSAPTSKKPKSQKRQLAGKVKSASLAGWRAELSEARLELLNEGYTGTLKFKKGLPLYQKVQEMRQAKLAAEL